MNGAKKNPIFVVSWSANRLKSHYVPFDIRNVRVCALVSPQKCSADNVNVARSLQSFRQVRVKKNFVVPNSSRIENAVALLSSERDA